MKRIYVCLCYDISLRNHEHITTFTGMQLCFGQPVDTEILTFLRGKVDELHEAIHSWSLEKEEV